MPVTAFLLSSGLLLNVAATVPTYNVKPTCRAAVEMVGGGRTAQMCEAGEAQARSEIIKEWPTFSEPSKERCIKTVGTYAASYIELVVCLQSMRDQQKRQEQEKASTGRPGFR